MEQTATHAECPSCQAKIEDTFFRTNQLIGKRFVPLIHEYTSSRASDYCQKCSGPLMEQARGKRDREVAAMDKEIEALLNDILVVSIHSQRDGSTRC